VTKRHGYPLKEASLNSLVQLGKDYIMLCLQKLVFLEVTATSYILIHYVYQSVTGLGKGRVGHGHGRELGTSTGELGTGWARADCVRTSQVPTSGYP
jgi:hypothetical protein